MTILTKYKLIDTIYALEREVSQGRFNCGVFKGSFLEGRLLNKVYRTSWTGAKKWKRDVKETLRRNTSGNNQETAIRPLQVDDLFGAYMFLLIGNTLSTLLLVIELVLWKFFKYVKSGIWQHFNINYIKQSKS
ncbi:uncharacterized protein LOC143233185 [Tachypleus tridentatus]|uniref:uncharacterized protein LOC143233185 n=1 Tax=Tachypleus tridentatus TaxID=6853 RepID=UPI003FD39010